MQDLTLTEALEKIKTYEAKFTKMDSTITELQTFVAEAKKAESEKEEKKDKTEEANMEEAKKAMKAAAEEKDPEKVKEAIRTAAKYMKAETEKEEKEEKKDEKTANLIKQLTADAQKPRMKILSAAYKQVVPEEQLKTYEAKWNKMSIEQLDAEIENVKLFMGNKIEQEIPEPYVPSTMDVPFQGSNDKDEFRASLEKMDVADLFKGEGL